MHAWYCVHLLYVENLTFASRQAFHNKGSSLQGLMSKATLLNEF